MCLSSDLLDVIVMQFLDREEGDGNRRTFKTL